MSASEFKVVKDGVRPDSRGRLTLGQVASSKSYRVLVNDAGQILLDPVVSIPQRELWLWQNPESKASVQRGIEQSAAREGRYLGDFAQYTDMEIED